MKYVRNIPEVVHVADFNYCMSGLQLALLTLTSELADVLSQCPREPLRSDICNEGFQNLKLNESKN